MKHLLKSIFLTSALVLSPVIATAQTEKPAITETVTRININSASQSDLEKLSGIGPAKAKAIIEYREKNGNFQDVKDLEKVKGIGPATMSKNAGKMGV